jgi:hypothetical protein
MPDNKEALKIGDRVRFHADYKEWAIESFNEDGSVNIVRGKTHCWVFITNIIKAEK